MTWNQDRFDSFVKSYNWANFEQKSCRMSTSIWGPSRKGWHALGSVAMPPSSVVVLFVHGADVGLGHILGVSTDLLRQSGPLLLPRVMHATTSCGKSCKKTGFILRQFATKRITRAQHLLSHFSLQSRNDGDQFHIFLVRLSAL